MFTNWEMIIKYNNGKIFDIKYKNYQLREVHQNEIDTNYKSHSFLIQHTIDMIYSSYSARQGNLSQFETNIHSDG